MKKIAFLLTAILAGNISVWAAGDMGRNYGNETGASDRGNVSTPANHKDDSDSRNHKPESANHFAPASRTLKPVARSASPGPTRTSNAVHIDISKPESGAHDRNFDTRGSRSAGAQQASYGQVNWQNQRASGPAAKVNTINNTQARDYQMKQQDVRALAKPGVRAAGVVHHHPYTAGYIRKKLKKIGVTKAPSYITDRSQIIDTDRSHSTIRLPQTGPQGASLVAKYISARNYNNPIVKTQMGLVTQSAMRDRVQQYNQLETQTNHYYWHADNGFNYCHCVDNWGYQWYGWYVGDRYFWTRDYDNRWWWYDTDYNRWCFWHDGFWWWQDPAHVGDLYCYNDDAYIPCNSAEDQIVVTLSGTSNQGVVYTSPDGTRQVKVMGDSKDAFLYDTATPPSFQPIYLASEVSNVQFSTNSGRPLEIVLTLGDGTFDLFDADGNSYNPGNYDADQSADANPGASSDEEPQTP
ncbi:MAG: hypothetical protein ACREL1_07250 [bacterium]